MVEDYASNVFINCPFDDQYAELRNAIVFAVFDCGFIARCAMEEDNGVNVRFEKIKRLIENSKFGIHDICRTEPDVNTRLPRFNMPLELGVFIGAAKFGTAHQKKKNILILDCEPYRYQTFISDISGHDIRSHGNDCLQAITHVRNWLYSASRRKTIPGGAAIHARYEEFKNEMPAICEALELQEHEVTFPDYCDICTEWLRKAATS